MATIAATYAIGNPVAFDAKAEDLDTRGYISKTTNLPFLGYTAK